MEINNKEIMTKKNCQTGVFLFSLNSYTKLYLKLMDKYSQYIYWGLVNKVVYEIASLLYKSL